MKITSVRTAATTGHCMHLWVKVETDAGITGLGECVHGGHQAIAIIRELGEKLVGRDPFAIDALFEETRRSSSNSASMAKGSRPTSFSPSSLMMAMA